MLLGLTLKNFAIVDDISINFGKGLNIITGETGAGKSLILNAINFILGDKVSTDIIKSGKEEAHVEALFDISEHIALTDRLNSLGIPSDGNELLIKRIIPSMGKGRVFINGSIATIGMLEKLTEGLIDIFGQHEHQSLLKEVNHLKVLDQFGGLNELILSYSKLYHKYNLASKEFDEFKKNRSVQKEKEDFLRFQCNEIDLAELKPGEEQQLHIERKILANSEKLYSITKHSYKNIYESEGSVFDILKGVKGKIDEILEIDGTLIGIAEAMDNGISEIQEAAFYLRDYFSDLHYDPERLDKIEDRLQDLNRIKQKHGVPIEEILEKREEMEKELEKLSNYDEREKQLDREVKELGERIQNLVTELTQKRMKAAERLSEAVEKGISDVGIKGGKFPVDIDKKDISPSGCDKVTLLF
ncbi:MAG: DNA repair protein RecN [Thermodesulfobacteriota bacterium]